MGHHNMRQLRTCPPILLQTSPCKRPCAIIQSIHGVARFPCADLHVAHVIGSVAMAHYTVEAGRYLGTVQNYTVHVSAPSGLHLGVGPRPAGRARPGVLCASHVPPSVPPEATSSCTSVPRYNYSTRVSRSFDRAMFSYSGHGIHTCTKRVGVRKSG